MDYRVKYLTSGMLVEELEVQASGVDEIARLVEARGGEVLSVAASKRRLTAVGGERSFNLTVLNQQLFALLEAGQTVVDAFEILAGNDRRERNRRIYDAILVGLRNGKQLSESMSVLPSVFPALYVAMIRSSETTGSIRTSLKRYMHYQRQVDEIRSKLFSAAVYPAVLLCVGFLVVAFLMLYVVPRFSAVFDEVSTAHQATSSFIQLWGGFVRAHTLLAWSGTAAFVVIGAVTVTNDHLRGVLLGRILALPWIGEKVRTLQFARLYRTLGMLLRNGLSVLPAVRMATAALPLNMHASIHEAELKISQGIPISRAFAEHGLGTEVAYRLLVAGESSGNIDEMMEKVADFYDQELATLVDTVGRLVEPALMIGIGLIIGAVVLMLYMPIFDLTSAV